MKRALGILLTTLVLAVTGCGGKSETTPHGNDYGGYDAEYQRARAGLQLPEGATWPQHVRMPPASMGKVSFENGAGTTDAQFYWLCNWAHQYLGHHDSPDLRADALTQLRRVKTMEIWAKGLDEELRRLLGQALAEAERGDVSTWRQLFGERSCVV